MVFNLHVSELATGTMANVFTELLALKFADTTGHRARLRRLVIGAANQTPQDIPVEIRIRRTNNTTDGASTAVDVNTIGKLDPLSKASDVSAIGKNHSAPPTTYETGSIGGAVVTPKGEVILEGDALEGAIWGKNQTLVIEGAPGATPSPAMKLVANLEWEEGF